MKSITLVERAKKIRLEYGVRGERRGFHAGAEMAAENMRVFPPDYLRQRRPEQK